MKNKKESIAILGLGKVGSAVGYLLRSAGYDIVAVASRTEESVEKNIVYTGGKAFTDFAKAADQADCIIIATLDDAIASVCETISKAGALRKGKKVIHMSGAGGLDILHSARQSGALVGSIHPIQSFADVESAIKTIPGSSFGITADDAIKDWCRRIVADLGGTPYFISEDDKPLYHAAACIASNYFVTLMNIVVNVYQALGFQQDEALRAFLPLVKGTLINVQNQGTTQSLTGPIARGDAGTIRKHLAAFETKLPEFLNLYRDMGLFTVDIAREKGTLPEERAHDIRLLLSGGIKDE
jgi:predicted short-subunit dehydrogenase-like oxidoreductase (DUF2520 family)